MANKVYRASSKVVVDGHEIENPIGVKVTVELQEENLPNTGARGGGTYKTAARASAIKIDFESPDFSTFLLERTMKADATAITAAPVADEPLTALAGKVVPTAYAIDIDDGVANSLASAAGTWAGTTAYAAGAWVLDSNTHMQKCTTAGTSGASEPTWKTDGTTVTDGTVVWSDMGAFSATDYTARTVGVLFGDNFPEGAPVEFTYESRSGDQIELATNTSRKSEILLDGWDDENNIPLAGRFYSVDLATSEYPVNSEGEYLRSPVTGTVNLDTTKPVNKSQFGYLFHGSIKVV